MVSSPAFFAYVAVLCRLLVVGKFMGYKELIKDVKLAA
jgi:hypothetical protein